MGLGKWLKGILFHEYGGVEEHTLSIQKWIMQTTFVILFGIIVYSFISINKENYNEVKGLINIFLPLLTSWIGAIIAFYFSKEISDALVNKIKKYKDKEKQTEESLKEIEEKYEKERESMKRKYQMTINRLIHELYQKKNGRKTRK